MPAELKSRWPETDRQVLEGSSRGVRRAGDQMKYQLIAELNAPKSGRVYPRGAGSHQASAPGESPASDYEQLERSIEATPESELTVSVGTDVSYAVELEQGSARIAPRPMWLRVGERMKNEVAETIATEIQRSIK